MYSRGDVVRSVDPFKLGGDAERFWLIVNDDQHPFSDEQYIAVSLSTTPHEPAIAIADENWDTGGLPEASVVLPWSLHSPRTEDITDRAGRLSDSFCGEVLESIAEYLS